MDFFLQLSHANILTVCACTELIRNNVEKLVYLRSSCDTTGYHWDNLGGRGFFDKKQTPENVWRLSITETHKHWWEINELNSLVTSCWLQKHLHLWTFSAAYGIWWPVGCFRAGKLGMSNVHPMSAVSGLSLDSHSYLLMFFCLLLLLFLYSHIFC